MKPLPWRTRIAAMAFGALLAACTQQQLQTSEKSLATLCQAYADAAPGLDPASGSPEASLKTYASAACAADGTVQPALQTDSGTATWLSDILQGLRIVVPLAAALA